MGKPLENGDVMGINPDLVGGFKHFFMTFHSVGNVMIPTDFHIFQRGRSTTNQWMMFLNALCSGPSY